MPAPTLSERTLANVVASRCPRAVVISLRKEIALALEDGLKLTEIWRQLHREKVLTVGYDRFRRLVRRYAPQAPGPRRARARLEQPIAATPNASASKANAPGFVFNAQPNPKELYG